MSTLLTQFPQTRLVNLINRSSAEMGLCERRRERLIANVRSRDLSQGRLRLLPVFLFFFFFTGVVRKPDGRTDGSRTNVLFSSFLSSSAKRIPRDSLFSLFFLFQ